MRKLLIFGIYLILCLLPSSLSAQDSERIIMPGLYTMPETAVATVKTVKRAGVREDLHKFMGYEDVLTRYVSLPYDTPMSSNFADFFADPGFLIILLLPMLLLVFGSFFSPKKQLMFNATIICLGVLLLIFSISGAFLNKNKLQSPSEAIALVNSTPPTGVLNQFNQSITKTALTAYQPFHGLLSKISGETDAVTYPLLVVLFALFLFLFNQRMAHSSKANQSLLILLSLYFFLWWILGSGMSWYGLLLFCLPYYFIIGSIAKSQFSFKNHKAIGVLSACVLWLLFAFVFRSTNFSPVNKNRAQSIFIPPILEYQAGNISKKQAIESSFPKVTEFSKIINQNTEGRVYRVGTQLKFFIDRNDKRVFDDTFLDFFEQMVQGIKDKQQIVKALKLNQFKYILLDLNLAGSDFTPEKSLTKKFTNFLNTLYNNPSVELVLTDRTLQLTENEQIVNGVFPENASIAASGRFALFRIK